MNKINLKSMSTKHIKGLIGRAKAELKERGECLEDKSTINNTSTYSSKEDYLSSIDALIKGKIINPLDRQWYADIYDECFLHKQSKEEKTW